MKVGLLTRFFDLRNAGIGRYSMALKTQLEKRGVEVMPISSGIYGDRADTYYLYNTLFIPFRTPRGCDIYHALSPIEAVHLAFKRRTVVTVHDLIPILHLGKLTSENSFRRKRFVRGIERRYFTFCCRMAAKCDAIICVSDETKNDLLTHFDVDADRVHVINPGMDPQLWRSEGPDDGHTCFRIGTLGSLDVRKRVHVLVKAFREANVKDSELLIVGRGMEDDYLRVLAADDERIKFKGFISDDRLGSFYRSIDLFCFPTSVEGYGLPAAEALACGVPVVILDDAHIPDEVRKHTQVTSIKELPETLRAFSTERKKPSEETILWARNHSWERNAIRTLEVYERLASSSLD